MRDDVGEADTMMFREEDNYKAFFKKAMKKFGISSPAELKPEDEKDFYNYVDRNYKAKGEKNIDEDATDSIDSQIASNQKKINMLKQKRPVPTNDVARLVGMNNALRDRKKRLQQQK